MIMQNFARFSIMSILMAFFVMLMLLADYAFAGTFRDDFEDGDLDGWQEIDFGGNGMVKEKEGKLIVTDVDRSSVTLAFFNNEQILKDFTLAVDVNMTKADAGSSYLWIVFRYTDTVFAFCGLEADNWPKILSIFQVQGAGFRWDIGKVDIPLVFEVGRQYLFKIEMKGAQATLWIDDQLMAQADWKNQPVLPKDGKVGLGGGGGEVHFDNFIITGDKVPDVGEPGEFAIAPKGKLPISWAKLKNAR